MMSNPPPTLQQRQRLHRRQHSTPVLMEAMKVPSLPPTIQRVNSHRRGQSLDQRSPIRRHQKSASTVSITNLGSTPHGQQILREAQQQKPARPGQRIEIPISPHCGTFPTHTQFSPMYHNATTMNVIMQNAGNMQMAHSPYYAHDMSMPMSAGFEGMGLGLDENTQSYFQQAHNIRHGFGDDMMNPRRMSQPDLHLFQEQRAITPIQQMNAFRYPLTPSATPFKPHVQHMQYSRTTQSSPITQYVDEMIEAPQPISMQRGRSLEGICEGHEVAHEIPSPPRTAPLVQNSTFEMAEMPVPESLAPPAMPSTFDYSQHVSSHDSPVLSHSPIPTFDPSPEISQVPFFDDAGEVPQLSNHAVPILPSSQGGTGTSSPARKALSPRRVSISDLNLEPGINASIEETNITLDDIAQFIEGPNPVDNKWICKYDDCNKRFGRKENIKSHVQTHLGDRQFRCDHCNKCFVRGHDLKRHAKIHTGTKPYPCLCGNAFARHDALTRHRQRGMCIGAFDGVVKKVIKRGRPRKHRPDMDERVDKATRARKRQNERGHHYASSSCDSSVSSWGSPPTEIMESLSIRGGSPFDEIPLFGSSNQHATVDSIGLPPDAFSFTPPQSPGYSIGNKPSPHQQTLTPTELIRIPSHSHSPARVAATILMARRPDNGPPSLSHSTSSPAPDIPAFDFSDISSSHVPRLTMKLGGNSNVTGADFDTFLDYESLGLDAASDHFFDGL